MQLNSFPQLSRPELRSAESGQRHFKAEDTHNRVSSAFDSVGDGLAGLDGTEYDYNPNPGEVVVVNRYLDNGPDTAVKVQSAELNFNPETGEVDRFKMIKDDNNSVTFEHKDYDEYRSSNPTFESVVNGQVTSFDLNPHTGLVVQFESN
jgi:hypothetical protein